MASNLTETALDRPVLAAANTEEVGVRGKASTRSDRPPLSLSATRIFVELGQAAFAGAGQRALNLYQPTFVAQAQVATLNPPKVSSTELSSLALADVPRHSTTASSSSSARACSASRPPTSARITGAVTSYYDQSALSPAVGFVVKPWQNVSIYGNYVQGMQQGPTAPAAARNSGQVFQPEVSTQFELGAKLDFGQFATTLPPVPDRSAVRRHQSLDRVFSVVGMQRNQGLEWTSSASRSRAFGRSAASP